MTLSTELPWLPQGWLDGIAAGDYVERARGTVRSSKAAFTWIKARPASRGEPCKMMLADLQKAEESLLESSGGGAHDSLVNWSYRLIANGAEGHRGCHTAVVRLGRAFVREVAERRRSASLDGEEAGTVRAEGEARREVGRAVVGAVRLMLGELNQPHMVEAGLSEGAAACSCWDAPADDPPAAKAPGDYELGELGFAEHLLDVVGGPDAPELIWVPETKRWYGWNADKFVWESPSADLGMLNARRLAPRVRLAIDQTYESLAGMEESDSEYQRRAAQLKKLFRAHEQLNQHNTLKRTLEQLSTWPQVLVNERRLDASERYLMCPDGKLIELNDDGFHVRDGHMTDYVTATTAAPYVPGARDPEWESYLDTFIPDLEVRAFVQRLLGYALLGRNSRRLLVFFQGPTSTGKSTILEAAGAALGSLSGSFDVSVFRQKADATPRPDLLRVMKLRLGFTSEAGAAQHLHADQIKRMTGGDSISARALFSNEYTDRVPAFTPFIATNDAPHIEEADAALWRRMYAVPFDVQVGVKKSDGSVGAADDTEARDRLRASSSARAAVLSWMLEGWNLYCERGLNDVPPAVTERTELLRTQVSDFHGWFHETLEITGKETDWVSSARLYTAYRDAMTAGYVREAKLLTALEFGHKLTKEGVPEAKGRRKRVEGKLAAIRVGVKFRGKNSKKA